MGPKYFPGHRPEYPDGVTARDIDGPEDEEPNWKEEREVEWDIEKFREGE